MARQSGNQIRLYGQVLSKMKVEDQVVWVTLTADDYESAGVPRNTYSGLSGYLVQSDEAYIAAEFKELGPGEVECHFRSIPGFDVSKVAFELGGGGHVQASGCTVRGKSLQDVEAMVIPMLKQAARAGSPLYE
jgi:phosphoesterase RecJ-like protein